MGKKMKKQLAWLLCLALCLSLFPSAAFAEDGQEETASPAGEVYPDQTEDTWDSPEKSEESDNGNVDEIPAHEHVYQAFVTEATCTEQGYTTYFCDCGDSYISDYTESLNHPERIDVPEEPATRRPDTAIHPDANAQGSFASDDEALRQLAFEEHKTHRKGELSMSVLGNIQSNTRPEGPTNKVRRTSGSFLVPAPIKPGISREGTEFSFGLPFSAGISLRYDFNPRWGIGTGVVYTNLSRSFLGDYGKTLEDGSISMLYDTDITNLQHYIGIPVNVFFNIVNTGNWNFHVRLDGMGEKLVDNHFLVHDSAGDLHLHQKAQGLQFSAGVGVGLEFKFSPNVGIYFDPTLRYYFNGNQPRSIRTIQPLRMDFEAGLRFSLGR